MVDTIRVKALQTMVNYRTPTSYLIRESYPLPPYSTIVGMIHSVCGFRSWRPMRVSVQGQTRGVTSDLFIRYSFAPGKFEKDRVNKYYGIVEKDTELTTGIYRSPNHTELLCDVRLVLHIQPEREEDFEPILEGLKNPRVYPSLGRYEDLLDIEAIDVVKIERRKKVSVKDDMYVPVTALQSVYNKRTPGTIYLLHKEFEYDSEKRRRWKDTIESRFIPSGISLIDFDADEDGLPVAFA